MPQTVTAPRSQEFKMATGRCVHLMLVGMANGVREMWISQQPFLLYFYLWQYAPTLAWLVSSVLGRKRMQNFKSGQVRMPLVVLTESHPSELDQFNHSTLTLVPLKKNKHF